jgi:Zn-dependent protease
VKLLILLLSGLKLGKLATTGGTMVLSMFTYALIYGWPYAVGFVLLLFVHEMGHYVAARQRGLDVGAPTFIPFVGAWIQLDKLPHDVETEAYIGIAGPVAGTAGAVACYYAARFLGDPLLLALAFSGCMLNLFNLIPLSPLDGGRITAIVSPKLWWIGVPVLIGLFLWRPSPMLILVAILAAPQLWRTIRKDGMDDMPPGYYEASPKTRLSYGIYYLGLAAFLGIMTGEIHEMMPHR